MSIRRAAPILLVSSLFACGCTGNPATAGGVPSLVPPAEASTVAVAARDIVSVVSLDGSVSTNPPVTFAAPTTGVVRFVPNAASPSGATVAPMSGPAVAVATEAGLSDLRALAPDGAAVTAGLPVLSARYTGFVIQATIPADKVYRLGMLGPARAQITAGPGPFDCPLLGLPRPSGEGDAGNAVGAVITCKVPADVSAIPATPAILAITTGSASNVPALPVEAVAGLSQQGQVTVVTGAGSEPRTVALGLNDGRYVQITSGLKVGDIVSLTPPGLRTP